MKLSIITVTLNSENTIEDTFQSIFQQTHPDIEYIVIDGGSTDGTLEVIKKYSDKITHFLSEKDTGIYDAMNKGLRLATGDVIGILNSDDIYPNTRTLELVASTFRKENCQALYGDLVYVHQEDTDKMYRYWRSKRYSKSKFKLGWMPPHPTFFVKKGVYDLFGHFDLRLCSASDYEIMFRFLYKHKVSVSYLPKVLVKMRIGGQSNESLKQRLLANREDVMAWRINGYRMPLYTRILKPLLKLPQFFKKAPRN